MQIKLFVIARMTNGEMKNFFSDLIGQAWTLLGMFVAWIVLEGSAKTVVGWLIMFTTLVWVLTYWIRKQD
jgi:hypothetical protein